MSKVTMQGDEWYLAQIRKDPFVSCKIKKPTLTQVQAAGRILNLYDYEVIALALNHFIAASEQNAEILEKIHKLSKESES